MGVVHRDVKPSNNNSAGWRAKLVDLGLAKATLEQSVTHAGAVVGSAHDMSPEQLRGEVVDARTDLYSVGVIHKMFTGRLPTALTDV